MYCKTDPVELCVRLLELLKETRGYAGQMWDFKYGAEWDKEIYDLDMAVELLVRKKERQESAEFERYQADSS